LSQLVNQIFIHLSQPWPFLKIDLSFYVTWRRPEKQRGLRFLGFEKMSFATKSDKQVHPKLLARLVVGS
jgi:hypothetical protein